MKVLLIVDLQNDFCKNGALAVPEGDSIVPVINDLLTFGGYDLKIATKDWHPKNHCSFKIWPEHCVQGTEGADFHPQLLKELIDKEIVKGCDLDVDSYGAFFDNERIHETELRNYLEEQCAKRAVKFSEIELHVCGLALDYCVLASALDARSLDIATSLILDATRAVTPGKELTIYKQLIEEGVEIIPSKEILQGRSIAIEKSINVVV